MSFGRRLQELRQQAGFSQSQLAERSGLSVRNIQNWEIGHRIPRADVVFKLAVGLGLDCRVFADSLLSADDEKPERKKSPGKSAAAPPPAPKKRPPGRKKKGGGAEGSGFGLA